MAHRAVGSVWKFKGFDDSVWRVLENKGAATNLCVCIRSGDQYEVGDHHNFWLARSSWDLILNPDRSVFTDEEYERLLV